MISPHGAIRGPLLEPALADAGPRSLMTTRTLNQSWCYRLLPIRTISMFYCVQLDAIQQIDSTQPSVCTVETALHRLFVNLLSLNFARSHIPCISSKNHHPFCSTIVGSESKSSRKFESRVQYEKNGRAPRS